MIRYNRRAAVLAVAGALTIAPAATGCGAGFSPQTTRPSQPPQGLNIQVPQDTAKQPLVEIRNLFVLGPADGQQLDPGASAAVYAELVNSNPSGQPDALESISSPSFAGGSQIDGGAVALPSQKLTSLNGGTKPLVILKGLTSALWGGQNVTLTLTFAQAGSVTVIAQAVPWSGIYATYPPVPTATPTPAPSATPGATTTAKAAKKAKPTPSPTH